MTKQGGNSLNMRLDVLLSKRSKRLKPNRHQYETKLVERANDLTTKINTSEEEKVEIKDISLKLDGLYSDLAKGAFIRSRAKWLEEGEKNSGYFFALEKRIGQRKTLTSLNIGGNTCNGPVLISKFVAAFYSELYSSRFDVSR